MHKRYDMAGVVVSALLAATGGSTLRDGLFLNQVPPVVTDVWYVPLILFAALVASLGKGLSALLYAVLLIAAVITAPKSMIDFSFLSTSWYASPLTLSPPSRSRPMPSGTNPDRPRAPAPPSTSRPAGSR